MNNQYTDGFIELLKQDLMKLKAGPQTTEVLKKIEHINLIIKEYKDLVVILKANNWQD